MKIESLFGNSMTNIIEIISIEELIIAITQSGQCKMYNKSKKTHILIKSNQKDERTQHS